MSRIVVIGGSGHVGSYLVPALAQRGHEVVNVSRGAAKPYRPHFAWSLVENVTLDRGAEEKAGRFGAKIAELRPDIVVDMISFDLRSTQHLVEALRGKIEQYLFCSSIWVYGRLSAVPSDRGGSAEPDRRLRTRQGGERSVAHAAIASERLSGDVLSSRPHRW